MSIRTAASSSRTDGTEQTTLGQKAVRDDIETLLSGHRELASLAYQNKPFYDTRIQTALRKQFGWDIATDAIRAHVEAIGRDTLKAYARPHPEPQHRHSNTTPSE